MQKVQYQVAGGNVYDKPWIWVCGHPQDFDLHFPAISKLLLNQCSCALWYDRDNTEELDEDGEAIFEKMRILVIMVTRRFLTEDNRALRVDIPRAQELKIPILPIAMDPDLSALFAEKLGKLQYLDSVSEDETAIPFADKLHRFLQGTMESDDERRAVHDAFDGHIFLSYRKADRRLANQLMRRIHSNEACQSMAIWYDEYLIPGEDYAEDILRHLEASDLMTLLVTPNLVKPVVSADGENRPNYVVKQEYPIARAAQKTIVPVELWENAESPATDRTLLADCFPELPPVVNGGEELQQALEQALAEKISAAQTPLRQRKADSAHDYLMGLAYLNGIDVERDPQRGISLLQRASDHGHREARSKLVDAYRTGQGVSRDLGRAQELQQSIIKKARQAYEKEPSLPTSSRYLLSLIEYAKLLDETEDLEQAADILRRAKNLCTDSMERFGAHDILQEEYILILLFSGRTELHQGKRDSGLAHLEQILSSAEDNDTLRFAQRKAWKEKAAQAQKGGAYQQAVTAAGHYLEMMQQEADRTGSEGDRAGAAEAALLLGDIHGQHYVLKKAQQAYLLAAERYAALWSETRKPGYLKEQIRACESCGALWESILPLRAVRFYRQAIELQRSLLTVRSSTSQQLRLCRLILEKTLCLLRLRGKRAAKKEVTCVLTLCEALPRENGDVQKVISLCHNISDEFLHHHSSGGSRRSGKRSRGAEVTQEEVDSYVASLLNSDSTADVFRQIVSFVLSDYAKEHSATRLMALSAGGLRQTNRSGRIRRRCVIGYRLMKTGLHRMSIAVLLSGKRMAEKTLTVHADEDTLSCLAQIYYNLGVQDPQYRPLVEKCYRIFRELAKKGTRKKMYADLRDQARAAMKEAADRSKE